MIYIFLGKGFEDIEALTPIDMLRRAGCEVVTVGIGGKEITSARGVTVLADITDNEMSADNVEMVVLPGGVGGTAAIAGCENALAMIKTVYNKGLPVAAICAAPTVLGTLGILEGKRAVCHPSVETQLICGELVREPIVRDGTVITARGAGVSLPFALALVAIIKGSDTAKQIASAICFEQIASAICFEEYSA